MLREVSHVRQVLADGRRRCFADEHLHLLIWYEEDAKICGFELSYGSAKGTRVVRWLPDTGLIHAQVDDGTPHPFLNQSPILTPCRDPITGDLAARFHEATAEMPLAERAFVEARLSTATPITARGRAAIQIDPERR